MQEKEKEMLDRYLSGRSSEEEKALIESWYLSPRSQKEKEISDADLLKEQLYSQKRLDWILRKPKKGKPVVWAAACIGLLCCGYLSYIFMRKIASSSDTEKIAVKESIVPGGNGATLTLRGGRKIVLNNIQNGEIVHSGGLVVKKTNQGELVYQMATNNTTLDTSINTLSTTRGQTFALILSDGSKVWLNAGSSVSFSASLISHGVRRISLHGEAFFQVARDRNHPFIVSTGKQEVEVLGTEFNVSSYVPSSMITTLVKGSIRLKSTAKKGQNIIISPGQQAQATSNGFILSQVDTTEAVAWKNGYFQFDEADLPRIMRDVGRWYNVDVIFEGKPSSEAYHLRFPRNQQLSDLIDVFSNYGIYLKIEGRQLIVKE